MDLAMGRVPSELFYQIAFYFLWNRSSKKKFIFLNWLRKLSHQTLGYRQLHSLPSNSTNVYQPTICACSQRVFSKHPLDFLLNV